MEAKAKYFMLDRTLKHLIEEDQKKEVTTSELSKKLDTEYHVMHNVVKNLSDKGYVTGKEVAAPDAEFMGDVIINVTPDGRYFLMMDGGFAKLYKKERLDTTWKIVSIVASIVNALALLLLSFLSIND